MKKRFVKCLSMFLILSFIVGYYVPVEARADNNTDYFSFTPGQYGAKLNNVLASRNHESYTAYNPDADYVATSIIESDTEELAATIIYSSEELNNTAKKMDQNNISLIVAFIFDDPQSSLRINQICISMIQTVDPLVSDSQALAILEKAKAEAKYDSAYEYNGALYQLFDKSDDTPYCFTILADGISTELTSSSIIASGYAVDKNGLRLSVGQMLNALELLITDKASDFYAGDRCRMKTSEADPQMKSVIEIGEGFAILSFSNAESDTLPKVDDPFQNLIMVMFLTGNEEANDVAQILAAIVYLTSIDGKDYESCKSFLGRLANNANDWVQNVPIEYMLAADSGMIGFSTREIAAYKNK